MDRIIALTGRPCQEDIEAIESELAGTMLEAINANEIKPLHQYFPSASDDALDLLHSLLQFNPNKRLTAEEALSHPYLQQYYG